MCVELAGIGMVVGCSRHVNIVNAGGQHKLAHDLKWCNNDILFAPFQEVKVTCAGAKIDVCQIGFVFSLEPEGPACTEYKRQKFLHNVVDTM